MLTAISRFGKTKAPCRLEVGGVLLDCVPVELSDCRVVFVITRAASKAKTRTKVTAAQAIGPPAAMLEWSVTLENITFDSLDELAVPLQFLLACGPLADVRRAQACLQRMIDANSREPGAGRSVSTRTRAATSAGSR